MTTAEERREGLMQQISNRLAAGDVTMENLKESVNRHSETQERTNETLSAMRSTMSGFAVRVSMLEQTVMIHTNDQEKHQNPSELLVRVLIIGVPMAVAAGLFIIEIIQLIT